MSQSWPKRKARLQALLLLQNQSDEEEEGIALDRILHGQSVIGQSCECVRL